MNRKVIGIYVDGYPSGQFCAGRFAMHSGLVRITELFEILVKLRNIKAMNLAVKRLPQVKKKVEINIKMSFHAE
jgi:hypothetical protein